MAQHQPFPRTQLSEGSGSSSLHSLDPQNRQSIHTEAEEAPDPPVLMAPPEHIPAPPPASSALKRHKLFKNIIELREHCNILVLGLAGAGKSSSINSIIRSVLKKKGLWAHAGGTYKEDRPNVTCVLHAINVFFPSRGEEGQSFEVPDVGRIKKGDAPRLEDVSGLPNENSQPVRTLLRMLLYGHLPLGTNLLDILADVQSKGSRSVFKDYPTGDKDLAIHRVIVVVAADIDLPMELIKAIIEVAQPTSHKPGKDNIVSKRAVPIFGLMTKSDIIEDESVARKNQFKDRKKQFIESCLLGVEANFGLCKNYVSQDGEINDPQIDDPILDFMSNVCDPSHHIHNDTWTLKCEESVLCRYCPLILVFILVIVLLFYHQSSVLEHAHTVWYWLFPEDT